jgi:hypothetical protein
LIFQELPRSGREILSDLLICDECGEEPIADDGDGLCEKCRARKENNKSK